MNLPLSGLSCFLLLSVVAQGAESSLRVATRNGVVQGKSEGAVRAFLGIPYALPPVGDLRWRPPAPAADWEGVRQATEFGPRPMQPSLYRDMVFRDPGCGEDCLSLNVWTPAREEGARLPVMVWIFGGGFKAGGTSERRQDGSRLAGRGVVVVSMNYRLGVFGFMVHPELVAESPRHAAGNYGLLDQLEALRWVRNNIAAFGGDPENVTIFGESAGSASVSALMASPLAKGLFHRAIGQSGALHFIGGSVGAKPRTIRETDDPALLAKATGAHTLAELRALPAEALDDAVSKALGAGVIGFGPTVDGYFLPDAVASIFSRGAQNDVPLLAGWTRDESGPALSAKSPPMEVMARQARDLFGERSEEFLRLYPSDTPEWAARSGAELAADRFIAFGSWSWMEGQARTGHGPIYRYRFDQAPSADFYGNHDRGVYHSADILYVFGSFDAQPQVTWTDTDRATSDLVQSYWVNFARTGNPNGEGLPEWPGYRAAADGRLMYLSATPNVGPDVFRPRYLFLDQILGK